MSGLRESQHLRIQLREIELATNNFETCIGKGGYGWVYKGQLSIAGKPTTVAVKRLNEQFGQGLKEFLTEIQLLTGQNHPNLISLLGFCEEGKEKIIVYEYAERGSLDRYLMVSSNTDNYTCLTWRERLRICIDAARGLDHLHNHAGKHQTIIHRDIKSSNILLNENWVAKISDLGLSKLSLAGLNRSAVISHACGTLGYCEPEYFITGIVTKESDVYSFGMVLFEVLCGRLCSIKHHDDGILLSTRLAKDYYEKNKLMEIIDPGVREEMSFESMNKFSAIAYGCLQDDRGGRPTMNLVVKELEEALKIQVEYELEKENKLKKHHDIVGLEFDDTDEYWETKLPRNSEAIIKMLDISRAIYTNKKKLVSFLYMGILFDGRNKYFWINNDGKICILISATRFLDIDGAINATWELQDDSRFSKVAACSFSGCHDIKCQIKTGMLSVGGTMYAASLVFKHSGPIIRHPKRFRLTTIKWKTQGLSVHSTHSAELTPKDGWYKIKMWHFINHVPDAHFDIVIEELSYTETLDKYNILIQGIEFQPVEKMMQHEEIQGFKSLSTSEEKDIDEDDAYWGKRLPNNYQYFVNMADKNLPYTTKKELYLLFCAGFPFYRSYLWFSLCKSTNGICYMLPASEILRQHHGYESLDTFFLSESRFNEVKRLGGPNRYCFTCKLRAAMFSPHHVYACYLVFKFADNNINQLNDTSLSTVYCRLDGDLQSIDFINFNLLQPANIPTIKQKNDYGLNDLRIEGLEMPDLRMYHAKDGWMQQREDGWMEVILCKPLHQLEDHKLLQVTLKYKDSHGIFVEGIEFRPMQEYS